MCYDTNKLPSHVEAQNTKRSGLQHSCTLFQKWFNFAHFKNAFLNQFNMKKVDRSCTIMKYFRESKYLNISVLSQATTM